MRTDKVDFYTEVLNGYEKAVKEEVKSTKPNPLPKTYKNLEEWEEDANERLSEIGNGKRVMNPRWHNLVILILVFVVILGVVSHSFIYGWGTFNDKFKDTVSVNQSVSLDFEQNVTVNNEINNAYTNKFENTARNNFTIITNIYQNCSG